MQLHLWAKHLLALFLGATSVAAWAPWAWWPLAPISYGLLFLLMDTRCRPQLAALWGLLFGLGLHLCGHGWVFTTMAGPAGMDPLSAVLASAVVVLGLALFTALPCGLHAMIAHGSGDRARPLWLQAASFASLMTGGEIVRALVWDRFSSLSLGYALIDTWLAGWAPVLGVYGLSWLGYWLAATLAHTLATTWRGTAHLLQGLHPLSVCLLLGMLLQQVRWTEPLATPLHFRLVQANTAQGDKFNPASQARITRQVLDMLTAQPADLIVAPETAFPLYWNALPEGTITALQDFATQSGSHLVFGVATVGGQSQGHNSMVHLQPQGTTVNRYDKRHLFPFGETTPYGLAWTTSNLAIPMQDLSPGAAVQPPFSLNQQTRTLGIGTLICNEIMLSDETRRWAPVASLLINPGNMAWFDDTLAIDQGQQVARMRALEVSRPILRVSNTGDTALILASGVVAQTLPVGTAANLEGQVTGQTDLTPYVRWGDGPVWALCLACITFALRFRVFGLQH